MLVLAGVDIGGSSVKFGLVAEGSAVVAKGTLPVQKDDPITTLQTVSDGLKALAAKNDGELIAVGIAVPGPLDAERTSLLSLPNLPAWNGFPIHTEATRVFGIPTAVENDANAAAVAEAIAGAARGSHLMLMVTLGTGVGGGIVHQGHLISGAFGAAGEFGHISIAGSDVPCACGKTGCLEALANERALVADYQRIGGAVPETGAMRHIVNACQSGEHRAVEVFRRAGDNIGIMLGGLCSALDPDYIVVGGGIANAGAPLFEAIKASTNRNTMPALRGKVKVVPASLGNDAGFIGAALIAGTKVGVLFA